ncbi:MAG: fructose-bisphosphatase class III, partial [Phycisphaerales bacterium]
EHAPFHGVEAAISDGADIVPVITSIRKSASPRALRDTDEGRRIARRIADLDALVAAYQEGLVQAKP